MRITKIKTMQCEFKHLFNIDFVVRRASQVFLALLNHQPVMVNAIKHNHIEIYIPQSVYDKLKKCNNFKINKSWAFLTKDSDNNTSNTINVDIFLLEDLDLEHLNLYQVKGFLSGVESLILRLEYPSKNNIKHYLDFDYRTYKDIKTQDRYKLAERIFYDHFGYMICERRDVWECNPSKRIQIRADLLDSREKIDSFLKAYKGYHMSDRAKTIKLFKRVCARFNINIELINGEVNIVCMRPTATYIINLNGIQMNMYEVLDIVGHERILPHLESIMLEEI